jgi:hypothetical protein
MTGDAHGNIDQRAGATACWFRPGNRAARVGEYMAVV